MSEFITKVVVAADNQTAPALNAATKGIQNYAKAATAAQSQVRGASRQSRAAFQQLGYQVQDISVQLQAGQSPFVVLAQQGSQVASIFGPGGAVLGALIAVGGAIAGMVMPSLLKTEEKIDDILARAEKVGLDPRSATTITYAEEQEKIRGKINQTRQELVKYSEQISLLSGQYREEIDQNGERTRVAFNLDQAIKENKRNLDDKLVLLRELYAQQAKYNNQVKNSSVFEYKHALALAETERRLNLRAELEDKAKTTLDRHVDEVARITAAYQEGVIEKATWIKLLLQENSAYEKTLPNRENETDLLEKQARAYENLKRSLDPAYGAYQNYYETATLINNSADTQENKITLLAVAYAKLYEALGLVGESQKKVNDSIKSELWEDAETSLDSYRKTAEDTVSMLDNAGVGALRSMEDAMIDLISGTSSVKDAFRDMASNIVKDLIRMQIQRSITGPLSGLLNTALGNFGTAMTYGTNVGSEQTRMLAAQDFEGGGYTGSGVRSGGLDGKGGFMAMVHPNETVIDHEKGSGGGGVTINQTIQVTTGVQQTVRAEIMGLMPQIANASKAAVLDAKKRGGSFAGAF